MRPLKLVYIPGSIIFYVADGIPHTATILDNKYDELYLVRNKRFLEEYDDTEGFVRKDICFHTNEIYLPEYPTKYEIKYYIELAKTVRKHGIQDFPKRVIYKTDESDHRPFIDFEEAMLFKLMDNNYYYYHTNGIISSLIDIHDEYNVKFPNWIYQKAKINPNTSEELIITENDVCEIYSFNEFMGEPCYKNVHTPVAKYWNLVYKR